MVITLIGYRGCGKSSVAPELAGRLGWSWTDSDPLIEQRAGCSIREIFESEGEAGFRLRESQVLAELLAGDRLVLAAGGGAILAADNRERMRAAGPVVWLQASAATLAGRIAADITSAQRRPSLTGQSITDEVAGVLAVREPLYRQAATLIVDAEGATPQQIAARICQQLGLPVGPEPQL